MDNKNKTHKMECFQRIFIIHITVLPNWNKKSLKETLMNIFLAAVFPYLTFYLFFKINTDKGVIAVNSTSE